jgi:hypothetical protein
MGVVVRAAGIVPVRLDLTHAGTAEQQLGMSLGTVLGLCTIAALVRLAGVPEVTAAVVSARPGSTDPAVLRLRVGPVTWQICDATAYTSLLRRGGTRLGCSTTLRRGRRK